MQTFLPYSTFFESARTLDNKRLGKQLMECVDIYRVLISNHLPRYRNHPAVLMWKSNLGALLSYGNICYIVWQQRFDLGLRGGKRDHKSGEFIREHFIKFIKSNKIIDPPWLGDEKFHSSHRSCLLAKSNHYSQFKWSEKPTPPVGSWPYYWPTKNGY